MGRRPRHARDLPPNVDVVIDLTSEMYDDPSITARGRGMYRCIPCLDGRLPAAHFVVGTLETLVDPKLSVFVHCSYGHSRSAAFAALLLQHRGDFGTWRAAFLHIKQLRPCMQMSRRAAAACSRIQRALLYVK